MPAPSTAQPHADASPRQHRREPVSQDAAATEPARRPLPEPAETTEEVIRWAAFSCLLVPVVLTVYGTSVGGAASAALGLAAVTTVCRVLLRRSERTAARQRVERITAGGPSGDGRIRVGQGTHRGPRADEESPRGEEGARR